MVFFMGAMQAAGFRMEQFTRAAFRDPVMTRSTMVAILLAGVLACPAVRAGDQHGAVSVVAAVTSSCNIGGDPSLKLARGLLDFGLHRVVDVVAIRGSRSLSQPVKGDMLLQCTSVDVAPEVSFGYGLHATGKQRNLEGPNGTLIPYELLRGGSASDGFWDDQSYPVDIVAGRPGSIPVYGRIVSLPANAGDGLYTDTVTVQVDF